MSDNQDNITLAKEHYERGKAFWAQGKRGEAITEYNTAVSLDANSPAATALELIYDIMDFFDPNQLNP
jgi:predicted negative regulator of RcsB-dependent stress response